MSNKERYSIKPFTNPSGTEVFRVTGRTADGTQIRKNFQDMREAIGFKAELEIVGSRRPAKLNKALRSQLGDQPFWVNYARR